MDDALERLLTLLWFAGLILAALVVFFVLVCFTIYRTLGSIAEWIISKFKRGKKNVL